MKKFISENKHIFLIILICIFSILPLIFIKDIPNGHDIEYHISRINGIKYNLQHGDLKALIHIPFFGGYGYANGLFYSNIFMYLPSFLVYLGMSLLTAYKILVSICTFATAYIVYFSVNKITKNKMASTIATILYVLAPYRMVDFYERGALGEIMAFIFAPLVILGLYELFYGDYKKWWYLMLGFAGLVLSHLISFVIFFLIALIICIININKFKEDIKRLLYLIIPAIVCIMLTSFFTFPMLEQLLTSEFIVNNVTTTTNIQNTTIPIRRIVLGTSFKTFPGGVGLVLFLITLNYFKLKKVSETNFKFMKMIIIAGLTTLISTTWLFPWIIFAPALASIQFAWRMLLPATVFFAFAVGLVLHYSWSQNILKSKKLLITLICISFISPIGMMIREYTKGNPKIDITDYEVINAEYLPYQTDYKKLEKRGMIVEAKEDIPLDFQKYGLKLTVDYENNQTDNYVELPLLYYLGYKAVDDNDKQLKIEAGTNNIIRVYLPDNKNGKLVVDYKGTVIQKISYKISEVTLGILIFISIYQKINKNNK